MDPSHTPRIWAIGISKLRDLYRDVASAYDGVADLRIVARGYEDAVNDIEHAGVDRPDVIVAAGSNGSYLKARTGVPVVLVAPTGFDVMHALARAKREADRVALVTHGETPPELKRFFAAFGVEVESASYLAAEDAEACVLDLRDRGVKAIVGPGLVTELAEKAGLRSVFLYSRPSVQAAIDTALEVANATLAESMRRRRLDQVLQNLRDGVIALDAQGRIEALSGKMAQLLRLNPSQAVGRRLAELAPDVAAAVPAAPGESLETVRGASYVVHRSAWGEGSNETGGAIVTFQESVALQRMDRSVRTRQRAPQLTARYVIGDLLGESAAIEAARARMRRYARSEATVLIRGESGTGKELAAQGIHNASARREFAFVALNCGAFPETLLESELFGYEEGAFTGARRGGKPGLIETAHRGTLFLDEIGEMPLPLQSRLLRVLQEREVARLGSTEPLQVDVRIIAATHRALTEHVEKGEFRADLFYRLNILNLALPPLRERAADIPMLAAHLLARTRLSIDDDALAILMAYRWPGNVRELQNVMERVAVEMEDEPERPVTPALLADIAPEIMNGDQPDLTLRARVKRTQADEVRAVLDAFDGDREKACAALGISKTTLWRKLSGTG
ncbi:propionate catabolism operon regulatory protein PrpR [Caballeronia cordobensis]|uniref:Propionate catabolism operon regulatory protein PrpR n=1 Tax=Caballeronia cordobensis TaxID=1353886 RepID=A0A158HRV2_CABCO|nr:propionate catabolism operon regulatory protein PrpR [Caballeronia cordobensis]BAO89265.1 Fis family proprionate catabolism activator [Burkholderia sp. RPE67]SAL46641.1 propionate catabolism operon regulatory protein PrpR [Caballeronia cordobensis]